MARNYPEFMDDIVYPLGYTKNVFDSNFNEFKSYVKRNYRYKNKYFDGVDVYCKVKILNINFSEISCIYFDSKGPTFTFSSESIYSRSTFDNLISTLQTQGLTIGKKENPNSIWLNYDNILEFNVHYIPDLKCIELYVSKRKADTLTQLSKDVSNQPVNAECIEISYSFVFNGNMDNNGNIIEDNLSSVKDYKESQIYFTFSNRNRPPKIKVILKKNNNQEITLFENEIIYVNLSHVEEDNSLFGTDWTENCIGINIVGYNIIIFSDLCYIVESSNGKHKANGLCWEFRDFPLIPYASVNNSKSLDKLYDLLKKYSD